MTRYAGPEMLTAAITAPLCSRTGAATELRPISNSSRPQAKPCRSPDRGILGDGGTSRTCNGSRWVDAWGLASYILRLAGSIGQAMLSLGKLANLWKHGQCPASAVSAKFTIGTAGGLVSAPLRDLLVVPEPHPLETDSIEKIIQGLTHIYTR